MLIINQMINYTQSRIVPNFKDHNLELESDTKIALIVSHFFSFISISFVNLRYLILIESPSSKMQ